MMWSQLKTRLHPGAAITPHSWSRLRPLYPVSASNSSWRWRWGSQDLLSNVAPTLPKPICCTRGICEPCETPPNIRGKGPIRGHQQHVLPSTSSWKVFPHGDTMSSLLKQLYPWTQAHFLKLGKGFWLYIGQHTACSLVIYTCISQFWKFALCHITLQKTYISTCFH